jgi:hypothetical protein
LFSVAVTAAGTPPAAAEPDDDAVPAVPALLAALDPLLLHPAAATDSTANPATQAPLNKDSFTAHLRVRQMFAEPRVWTDTPPPVQYVPLDPAINPGYRQPGLIPRFGSESSSSAGVSSARGCQP